jgi:type II protein arginine methyltransferase
MKTAKHAAVPPRVAGLFSEAVEAFTQQRHGDAKRMLDEARPFLANDADYLRLRGVVLAHLGQPQDALTCLRKAVGRAPSDPANHLNLADHYRTLGQDALALQHYRKVLDLDPGSDHARGAYTELAVQTGEFASRDQIHAFVGDRPELLMGAAIAMGRRGDKDEAIRLMEMVVALAPRWTDAVAMLRKSCCERVNSWHFPMMRDTARNDAYEQALRKVVGPATHVLEIGTGSGLLAMLAARAGAARVTTCEAVGVLAETAGIIVRANNLGDRIAVINKRSYDLQPGRDMPRRADLLIAEIIGDELLSEGVLGATLDAKRRLLTEGATLIPCRIASMSMLVAGDDLRQLTSVDRVSGFDLSAFNRFTPSGLPLHEGQCRPQRLSETVTAFDFDLRDDLFRPEERLLRYPVTADGTCIGVLQWIRLYVDDEIILENAPVADFRASGWRPYLFPFAAPVTVTAGQTLPVRAKHNLESQTFQYFDSDRA